MINTVFKTMKNSISMIWKYEKIFLIIKILVTLIQGILPAVAILIMKKTINLLQIGLGSFEDIRNQILLYVLLNILLMLIDNLFNLYKCKFMLGFSKDINLKILGKASRLKLTDYENPDTYDFIERAKTQNGNNLIVYMESYFEVVKQIITVVGMGYVLIKFRWWIVIIVVILPIVNCFVVVGIDKKWYKIRVKRTAKERKALYINFLIMTGKAFKEIKLLGLFDYLINKYKLIKEEIINQDYKMQKLIILIAMILEMFDCGISLGSYIYICYVGYLGIALIGDVVAYIECINNIKDSTQNIFNGIEEIVEQSLYIEFLFEFLNMKEEKAIGKIKIDNINSVRLDNVTFQYSNGEAALKNINIEVNRNERVAIIGENGSGKTTLIKLMLGLYDNYDGKILINGVDMKAVDIDDYHKKISAIFQDYLKLEMSLRENIAAGNIINIDNDDLIWNKICAVNLDDRFISKKMLDNDIGNWFGNEELSAGEWQRIAIARMLMADAQILFCDEPDASLDIVKQNDLINTFNTIAQNKTVIYISHRIEYIHFIADRIILLKEGNVIEEGTHEELIRKNGTYSEMFKRATKLKDIS